MNQVIRKSFAINKAIDLYKTRRTEYANLYISKETVKVKQLKDYLGNEVSDEFEELDKELSGWVCCFDATPFANWEHPCKYLFLINIMCYKEVECCRGLDERVAMEKIY